MPYTAADLIRLLDLETIEKDVFRGANRDLGAGRIFGGQVLAQALVAASRTVPPERPIHSLHGYFMLQGDLSIPVLYLVDRIRDGKSFTTRRVNAIQNGQAIFSMAASFHRAEDGPSHQMPMPQVPPPEDLRPELELLRDQADRLPAALRGILTQDRPIDFRPVDGLHPYEPHPREPRRFVWLKAIGETGEDPVHHQAMLAYASDYGLLGAALQAHGLVLGTPGLMIASLDHAIWLHRPVRMDEWLLHVIDSPTTGGARAFSRGTFYSRDGTLVASTAQEGLLRVGPPAP
jgi:acyl-CoA thioesterase II